MISRMYLVQGRENRESTECFAAVPSAQLYDERLQLLILMDRSRSCPHMASSKGRDTTFRARELGTLQESIIVQY